MDHLCYFDNAATTPICEAAKKVILENMDEFYNPNSSYEAARRVKLKVEDAREKIASLIGAEPDEIYFTSGGSESNSWVINNFYPMASSIEHHSNLPHAITEAISVDENGIINLDEIEEYLTRYPFDYAVSCIMVNNELGVIEPIDKITELVHRHSGLLHVDAVQGIPHMRINVDNIDVLSASAHKFGGVKGAGFLYIKRSIDLRPLIYGGSQEQGIRGGTTNVLGVLAMAAALEDTVEHMDENNAKVAYLMDKLKGYLLPVQCVAANVDYDKTPHINSILNLRIDDVHGADVVAMCDEYNIAISAGSACNEGDATPSHVLKAIGLTDEEALSSIRISLSHNNTEEEIDYAGMMIPKIITRLRNIR